MCFLSRVPQHDSFMEWKASIHCDVPWQLPFLGIQYMRHIHTSDVHIKTVLKPVWTYGTELWGCATKSNIAVIQRYQSKLLRTINNTPWYVFNQTLHSDLHIPHGRTVFRERTATHHTTLDSHPNPLMEPQVHPPNKRRWTPPKPPPTGTTH
jgi:hypothetical protein